MTKKILQVEHLCKEYTTNGKTQQVLQNLSFEMTEGEFIAIMGPSGSGKTTLLQLIATIDKPTSGKILIEGKDVVQMPDKEKAKFRRNRLGFVFQDYNLIQNMTVWENIALPLILNHASREEQEHKVKELAVRLQITETLDKLPPVLSGGERQRASIARALIMQPALLLADEPTGALDSQTEIELLTILQQMNQEFHTTILMVTHDDKAASYAHRIAVCKDKVIVL